MPLSFRERQAVLHELAQRYQTASKKEKGRILDQAEELLGLDRCSAVRALRRVAREGRRKARLPLRSRLGRKPLYDEEVKEVLRRVWAATIDRLLAPERKRPQIKGRSGTKPGTLLKQSIPIKTFAEWDDASPGFLEVDLVAHDGGNPCGDYAQTLDTGPMVPPFSPWKITRSLNRPGSGSVCSGSVISWSCRRWHRRCWPASR
ncbi:MAG: hypothetical protein QN198_06620, partial [Armatimonadota bacterium]|nr:hypothetical protein [Armatimonadota bacterium]